MQPEISPPSIFASQVKPLFVFTLLIFFNLLVQVARCCHPIDRLSLQNIQGAFIPLFTPLNWTSSVDCCKWEGINCDQGGRVSHLWLPSRNLGGHISASISNLTHLSHLSLSNNRLYNSFDSFQSDFATSITYLPANIFASLDRLEVLDLSSNYFTGVFPSFSTPTSLRKLDVSSNDLHGQIVFPPQFSAPNLTRFNVASNQFGGILPTSICANSTLQFLDFSYNHFFGQVPRNLAGCSQLRVLNAQGNYLSGHLLEEIFNISTLTSVDLSSNHLTGIVPLGIWNLANLLSLDLSNNNLDALSSSNLSGLTNLNYLDLSHNNLSGSLSAVDFSVLANLHFLDLGYNDFAGKFPNSLYSCTTLIEVRINNNQLAGTILPNISSLASLSLLLLSDNHLSNFSGTIHNILQCKALNVLGLANNFMGESDHDVETTYLPSATSSDLQFLDLHGCGLTRVPTWLNQLTSLLVLDLSSNNITGSIPITLLSTLPTLVYIDLSSNQMSGEIPLEMCSLPGLVANNSTLTDAICYRENLLDDFFFHTCSPALSLANNNLVGRIPLEICRLHLLSYVNVSHNRLTGSIPRTLSIMTNLETLDFSYNNLSGGIPSSIGMLPHLFEFNVSYNNLEGQVPASMTMQDSATTFFGPTSFLGNPKLHFPHPAQSPQQPRSVSEDNNEDTMTVKHHHKEWGMPYPWFGIDIGLGCVTGFVGVCYSFLFFPAWRNAYFNFLINVKDQVYVFVVVRINKLRRKN